jgi:hypothetical protein
MKHVIVCAACALAFVTAPGFAADCFGHGITYSEPYDPGSLWSCPCDQAGQGLTGTYLEDRKADTQTPDLHTGIDIHGAGGTNVRAVADGKVLVAEDGRTDNGNHVIVWLSLPKNHCSTEDGLGLVDNGARSHLT